MPRSPTRIFTSALFLPQQSHTAMAKTLHIGRVRSRVYLCDGQSALIHGKIHPIARMADVTLPQCLAGFLFDALV